MIQVKCNYSKMRLRQMLTGQLYHGYISHILGIPLAMDHIQVPHQEATNSCGVRKLRNLIWINGQRDLLSRSVKLVREKGFPAVTPLLPLSVFCHRAPSVTARFTVASGTYISHVVTCPFAPNPLLETHLQGTKHPR
jgi:hypothetical protein